MSDTVSSGDGGDAIHRGKVPVVAPVPGESQEDTSAEPSGSQGDEAIHRG